jgi:hypothetical protein
LLICHELPPLIQYLPGTDGSGLDEEVLRLCFTAGDILAVVPEVEDGFWDGLLLVFTDSVFRVALLGEVDCKDIGAVPAS